MKHQLEPHLPDSKTQASTHFVPAVGRWRPLPALDGLLSAKLPVHFPEEIRKLILVHIINNHNWIFKSLCHRSNYFSNTPSAAALGSGPLEISSSSSLDSVPSLHLFLCALTIEEAEIKNVY